MHLDQIAETAGVSKPVLYRYFTDKDDLLAAVARWESDRILAVLTEVIAEDLSPRERVERGTAAYLAEVEAHRNVFLLAVRHHGGAIGGTVADGKAAIAAILARLLGDELRKAGFDAGGAEPWAHAIVGLGVSTAEWWLERQTMSRGGGGGLPLGLRLARGGRHRPGVLHRQPGRRPADPPPRRRHEPPHHRPVDRPVGRPDLHDGEGYTGPAQVRTDDVVVTVEADLRGGFQPLDGQFHWYGRVRSDSLTEATRPGGPLRAGTQVRVRTSYGESAARLSDPDPWGRFRVSGTGRPPFPLEPGEVHD